MSFPEGPKNVGTGPVSPQAPSTSPKTEVAAPTTGTTDSRREVTKVAGAPTQGLRASAGESRAPTTKLSERTVREHSIKALWNSFVSTVKGWFIKPPVERTDRTAESLFQTSRKTDGARDLSNTRITAGEKTPKLSELLKDAPTIEGKPSLSFVDFSNCQFDLKDLSGVHFTNCSFANADLSDCHLDNTSFSSCDFNNANLQRVSGNEVHFNHCAMKQTDLSGSLLSDARFEDNSLNKASFSGATLTTPIINDGISGKMKNCNFRQATIERAQAPNILNCGNSFAGATLQDMNVGHMRLDDGMSGATLRNIQSQSGSVALSSRISGLRMENSPLKFGGIPNAPGVQCTLYNCDFNNVQVHANGNRVNMSGCQFQHCDLENTSFNQGTWSGVTFSNSCNMQRMKTQSMEIKDSAFRNCDMRNSQHVGNGIYRCTFFSSDMEGSAFRYLPNSSQGLVSNTRFVSVVGLPNSWGTGKPSGISMSGVTINNCTAMGDLSTAVSFSRPLYN